MQGDFRIRRCICPGHGTAVIMPLRCEEVVKLSLVMPARNEEGCIAATLDRFADVLTANGIQFEIVVVDDGSTDATADH